MKRLFVFLISFLLLAPIFLLTYMAVPADFLYVG